MRVLVTGGAGFIASHVVDALVERGADVLCVDSLDSGVHTAAPDYLNPNAEYRFEDLRAWRPDKEDRCDAVAHFAALGGVARASREPGNLVGANAGGTARLVEAISSWDMVGAVVVASSFSVYGAGYLYRCIACGAICNGDRTIEDLDKERYEIVCRSCGGETRIEPLDESGHPDPLELYGASKLMQELCFRGFSTCPVHILRQSSVYGTRLRLDDGEATIIARIAGWIRDGHAPQLLEDGRQIRDWVHVDDVVAATLALVEGAPAPPIINLCTGVETSLVEACRYIGQALGSPVRPEVRGGHRVGDMRHCLGDPTVLTRLLGRPPIPFADGVRSAFVSRPIPPSG